jgi:hypothetical protein
MPRKRHKPEEIVAKLRQVDVLVSKVKPVAHAVRVIGVTEVKRARKSIERGCPIHADLLHPAGSTNQNKTDLGNPIDSGRLKTAPNRTRPHSALGGKPPVVI